jgi:hypothetical protein
MIQAHRFKAHKALNFDSWAQARLSGVTATEVANAATPAGFEKTVAGYYSPPEPYDNPYMEFGRRTEAPVGEWLKDNFEIFPNEWLISHDNPLHLATPDGLSLDHNLISEIKTTGKDFGLKIPIAYQRQVQWQLYVTGAEYCVFAWMLRVETLTGEFQPGWIEPKTIVIHPSAEMIEDLTNVANRLWEIKREALGKNGEQ